MFDQTPLTTSLFLRAKACILPMAHETLQSLHSSPPPPLTHSLTHTHTHTHTPPSFLSNLSSCHPSFPFLLTILELHCPSFSLSISFCSGPSPQILPSTLLVTLYHTLFSSECSLPSAVSLLAVALLAYFLFPTPSLPFLTPEKQKPGLSCPLLWPMPGSGARHTAEAHEHSQILLGQRAWNTLLTFSTVQLP